MYYFFGAKVVRKSSLGNYYGLTLNFIKSQIHGMLVCYYTHEQIMRDFLVSFLMLFVYNDKIVFKHIGT
jgi:hypothetical protein